MDGIKTKKLTTKSRCLSVGILLYLLLLLEVSAIRINQGSDSRFLGTAAWKTFDLFTFGAFEKRTNYTEERQRQEQEAYNNRTGNTKNNTVGK